MDQKSFKTKSRDQVDDVTNQLNLSSVPPLQISPSYHIKFKKLKGMFFPSETY